MLIAVKADNKEFISQTACQSLLNTIWMGKMMQENGTWRVRFHGAMEGRGEARRGEARVYLSDSMSVATQHYLDG